MCFRPAEVSFDVCPECGKTNKPIAKTCEQCGAPLEMKMVDADADQAKLDAANVFGAPGGAASPAAPKAPAAPPAPGAPKAPGAPPSGGAS